MSQSTLVSTSQSFIEALKKLNLAIINYKFNDARIDLQEYSFNINQKYNQELSNENENQINNLKGELEEIIPLIEKNYSLQEIKNHFEAIKLEQMQLKEFDNLINGLITRFPGESTSADKNLNDDLIVKTIKKKKIIDNSIKIDLYLLLELILNKLEESKHISEIKKLLHYFTQAVEVANNPNTREFLKAYVSGAIEHILAPQVNSFNLVQYQLIDAAITASSRENGNAIVEQSMNVLRTAQQVNQEPAVQASQANQEKVINHVAATARLVREPNKATIKEYKESANDLHGKSWGQALRGASLILAGTVTALLGVGLTISTAGLGSIAGGTLLVAGTSLIASGIGLFGKGVQASRIPGESAQQLAGHVASPEF